MGRVALLYSYLHKNTCLFSTIFHKSYMHNYETFYCITYLAKHRRKKGRITLVTCSKKVRI